MKVEKETLVLGVGNLLLKDEGVGIHVIKALENEKLGSRPFDGRGHGRTSFIKLAARI